jgi:hypothetical protein
MFKSSVVSSRLNGNANIGQYPTKTMGKDEKVQLQDAWNLSFQLRSRLTTKKIATAAAI